MAYYIIFEERGKERAITSQPFRQLNNALACISRHYGFEVKPMRCYLADDRKGQRFLVSSKETENGIVNVYLEHK